MSNFFGFQGGGINNGNINKGNDKSGGFMNKFSSALGHINQALNNGNNGKNRKMYVEGACKQDAVAAMQLYKMYAEGDGVEKDDTQAWFWARLGGEYGDGRGDYLAGLCYKDGIGVTQDLSKAWQYMERAMRRGCEEATPHYWELTEQHIVHVQSTPQEAKTYDRNQLRAMQLPPEEYFSFCMKVASFEDDNDGKNWLGLCYREGNGTAVDDIASVHWLKKSVAYGNIFALWNLAHMYGYGRGVLVDYHEALRLAEAAAQKGHKAAGEYAARLRRIINLSGEQLEDKECALRSVESAGSIGNNDPGLGLHYKMLAARKGHARSCTQVAAAYRGQKGVKRDYNESLFYYGKAVLLHKAKGDGAGITYLGISQLYALGLGVEKNLDKADYYFKLAKKDYTYLAKYNSITDYMNAQLETERKENAFKLAELYHDGFCCVPDITEALKHYELCVKRNYTPAFDALITIYHTGHAVQKNDDKAWDYMVMWGNGISSVNNPNTWKQIHWSTVCGLVLNAYNDEKLEYFDVLTADMAIEMCRKAYYRNEIAFAAICRDAASVKGAANANEVWQNLENEARAKERKAQEKAEQEAREKAEREAKERAAKEQAEREVREKEEQKAQKTVETDGTELTVTEIKVDEEGAEVLRKDWEEYKEKMSIPENQNAQMEPEKKPIESGGYFDAQIQEIRRLTEEKKFDELTELGYKYFDEENETYNERLGILCMKTAMLHGDVNALCAVGMAFAAGSGVPRDLQLAEKILCRIAEIDSKQINKSLIAEMLNDVREEMQEGATQEEMEGLAMEYQEIADGLEESYYPEEAWKLYEYYRMSTHEKSLRGYRPKIKLKDKYFSQRVDWEQVLAMPWEMFCQTGEATKDITVNSLAETANEQEGMPDDLEKYFAGMIGMESVKEQLDKIYQAVKMQLLREKILRERGEEVKESEKGYNFILLGNPGTGKTTVARIIAQILYDIKIRTSDSFIEIERSGVVSDHVGGTENRMREILSKVEGGTLFVDEAYALYKEDSDTDFGQEAIDVLMKDMEDHRNSYSVIMAGYKEPMMNMIKNANSGFGSRFSYYIELPDYSDEALIEIAHKHIEKQKFVAGEGVDAAIKKCIAHDKLDHTFGNARYVRELVHRAIENQSQRLTKQGNYENEELFLLKAEDFWQGVWEEEGVDKYLAELNGLTGLQSVKEEVNSLINLITVQKEMERRGMESAMDFGTLHMAFKGNPGTGKTTVARIIGKLYAALGVLKRGDVFVECTRADLVGKFQGHTAANVKKVVESALGGILFIDEAYSLVQGDGDSFGREAVDTLVAEMENNRKNLVVIFAGYTQDLDEFFQNNQGLKSRVPKELFFQDYNLNELYEIGISMMKSKKLLLTEAAEEAFRASLVNNSMMENFGNARGVRNLVDSIQRKQNVRIAQLLKENAEVSDELLMTIDAEDVM